MASARTCAVDTSSTASSGQMHTVAARRLLQGWSGRKAVSLVICWWRALRDREEVKSCC